jgi:hypothetical protein
VATVEEVWRVIYSPAVLADAAAKGQRVEHSLEAADGVCERARDVLGDAHPDLDDVYHGARMRIQEALIQVHPAVVRLRHLGG